MIEFQQQGVQPEAPEVAYLQNADLLVHQALALVDRDRAAVLLFDAAVKALQLDMGGEAAIKVARHWAASLKVGD